MLHAFDLLDLLGADAGSGTTGITDLARRTGLSKSTVHALLATLEARGAVHVDRERRQYGLGWRLFELGSRVADARSVPRVAREHLRRLAARTDETALLGVLYGTEVLYLDVAHGTRAIQFAARVGHRGPLHATGTGKVLLAFGGAALFEAAVAQGLARFTPATICDPEALRAEMDAIRSRGHALVREEREAGLSAVAAPVRDHTGAAVAAIGLAGPTGRFDAPRVAELLEALRGSAAAMSRELGN